MKNRWVKKINQNLSVSTCLSGDGEWELFFKGEQGKKELEYDTIIRMWAGHDDPKGVQAKKVHDRAVLLLEAKTTLRKTHDEINAMVDQLIDEMDR